MNILYCGDKNLADGLMISTLSLLRTVREPLHITVLTMDYATESRRFEPLPAAFAEMLERRVKQTNQGGTVRLVDITALFLEEPPTANLETRFTPCCMLRLYADLIPDLPERLLYLESVILEKS